MGTGPPVVLDCDPGHDDVIALVLAAARTDLLGVTTVAGNASLARSTENALAAAELLGLDVDVRAGADRPLLRRARHASRVHGESGLVGVDLPPSTRTTAAETAVEWILEESRRVDGLWIVATGPLTNVALALRADPRLAGRLAGISLMGGGIDGGNATAAAEFNLWFDPEAAAVVFGSGVPLRMCGLEVTHQVLVRRAFTDVIASLAEPVGPFVAQVMAAYAGSYRDAVSGEEACPLHDPCAVLALTDPKLFEWRALHVEVETRGSATSGMTVADRRNLLDGPAPNVEVAVGVDVEGVLAAVHSDVADLAGRSHRST